MPDPAVPEGLADELWAFSLDLYARPGVAAACLRLQDEQGLDVNMLLLCCWLARSGRGRLSEGDLAAAEARAEPWRCDILAPLRAVRRALKIMPDCGPGSGIPALYDELKRLELRAEREEQRRLLAGSWGRQSAGSAQDGDLTANLCLYLARHGYPAHSADGLITALLSIG
jgi:uncharacterized protein (TIGR02444 family)